MISVECHRHRLAADGTDRISRVAVLEDSAGSVGASDWSDTWMDSVELGNRLDSLELAVQAALEPIG